VPSVRVADAALASEHASQSIYFVVGFAEPVFELAARGKAAFEGAPAEIKHAP
jgi:hypothetical protein